jgi:hypothetical protein
VPFIKKLANQEKTKISKKKNKEVDEKNLPVQMLGGAVVYARDGEEVYLALVHDVFGHWTLTKGRIEEGIELEKGTLQGIKDELRT